MTKRMLIDATHEEETRVAVVDSGNKLLEYDYESRARKPLKGSIFLAKVTRVEPSLQAAFVNFGGNRHGFLPFSEIHPDYFRIPIADREALIAEQQAAMEKAAAAAEEAEKSEESEDSEDESKEAEKNFENLENDSVEDEKDQARSDDNQDFDEDGDENKAPESEDFGQEEKARYQNRRGGQRHYRGRGRGRNNTRHAEDSRRVEILGGEEYEDDGRFRFDIRRKYKIQEVIKRGQIMLVQASREERGNKGAAVSTYLSLPGRYCVLMPNSPRGGGVSRKIASYKDRARMREILRELNLPEGMSVIVRTAGVSRTKAEIKRDLDYLMRLWNNIRELTLESSAPALIYEEADLIKRSIRDLYTRDIEDVIVAGEKGFKSAKSFMKLMIPSHVKRVKEDKAESFPLFQRYRVENQIAEIGVPSVSLPSGGYLVINPTEALVSIDVNSGRATKERHIEETAVKTNLEAAEEVARQLRLRDLGGLVVIDFIDMEDRRNNAKVERKIKESLSNDRARIQIGRISSFGLMELSRQRLNPSLTEAQFELCPHCNGIGHVRTVDGLSILVLRAIEEEGTKARAAQIIVHMTNNVALYILNNKRRILSEIETRYNFEVVIRVDDALGSSYRIEVSRPAESQAGETESEGSVSEPNEETPPENKPDKNRESRRRGRRGGRRRSGDKHSDPERQIEALEDSEAETPLDASLKDTTETAGQAKSEEKEQAPKKKPARRKTARSKETDSDKKTEQPAEEKRKGKQRSNKPASESASKKKDSAPIPEAAIPPAPSNDAAPEPKKPVERDYETVNKAPDKKRKGWWNRLTQ